MKRWGSGPGSQRGALAHLSQRSRRALGQPRGESRKVDGMGGGGSPDPHGAPCRLGCFCSRVGRCSRAGAGSALAGGGGVGAFARACSQEGKHRRAGPSNFGRRHASFSLSFCSFVCAKQPAAATDPARIGGEGRAQKRPGGRDEPAKEKSRQGVLQSSTPTGFGGCAAAASAAILRRPNCFARLLIIHSTL